MAGTASKIIQSEKPVWYFILGWTVLNLLQAYTLELHADEAYYWMYSRLPAWGYFDHPPMVAAFIAAGSSMFHNELGVRLLTVLSSSATIYIMWLILKPYRVGVRNFILVMSGIFVFHIYGFTTTPDSPLLLFTVLFLYIYQKYLARDSWQLAAWLGLIIACLLYSKYHGILLVGLTVLSNLKLLKRPSFWGIAVLAVALYVPHIIWQAQHGYPSINYHLSERSAEQYNLAYSYQYPLGQLIVAGPLIGWYLFYHGFRRRTRNDFTLALLFNAIGILLFFFFTSLKGEVQPHWTLIAYVPLALLVLINMGDRVPGWFGKLAMANLVLIVVVRLCIMSGLPFVKQVGAIKSYFGFHEWATAVHQKAGDNYVIFNEGFQNPSKYNFYNTTLKGFAYDSRYYRRTQYDIWPIESGMQRQKAYFVLQAPLAGVTTDTIQTTAGIWYAGWINDVRTYQLIDFKVADYRVTAKPGQKHTFDLSFTNPYPFPVNFSNSPGQHQLAFEACFFNMADLIEIQPADGSFYNIKLQPGESTTFKFTVKAPAKKGRYDLFFSLRTEPFPGAKNNRLINFIVE